MAQLGFLRRLAGERAQLVLLIGAVGLLVLALAGFYYVQSTAGRNQSWLQTAKNLSEDVLEVGKIVDTVSRGLAPDFPVLLAYVEDYNDAVAGLTAGDPEFGIVGMPESVQQEVAALSNAWAQMKVVADDVLVGETPYLRTAQNVINISTAVPEVMPFYEQAAQKLAQRGAPPGQVLLASSQMMRLERLQNASRRVLSEGRDAEALAAELDKAGKDFSRVNRQLLEGGGLDFTPLRDSSIDTLIRSGATKYEGLEQAISDISLDSSAVGKLQSSAASLDGESANVIATAKALEQALLDHTQLSNNLLYISFGAGALALIALIGFVYLTLANQQRRVRVAEERDSKQQQAILGLLDDITNLADGDLTTEVKVTEDFTGAISDSLNYTVSNMRTLVGTINTTSAEIATAAAATAGTARSMSEASERQAREITAASGNINASAQSLQQVASRAEQLAQQAQSSVQTAREGSGTVGRTIQGMSALREQIQDTSKRIKRLGESSQEIGNIVEFINDIAEQTNTLALNASIQAAMAGEQGRGFAVVADEVQRLAERAGQATRQIESLVKTIQADTSEAIISMERSTLNVVTGAKSAEEAGQSLTKIENSSQELARLITEISSAARNQSGAATKIAGAMQVIRDIAVQTSGSAGQTAQAVSELNNLSVKLRESVAGFKLPA